MYMYMYIYIYVYIYIYMDRYDNKYSKTVQMYRGENAVQFMEEVFEEVQWYKKMKLNKDMY